MKTLHDHIPLYNPTGARERLRTRDVLPVTEGTLPMDMDFLKFLDIFSLPE
jgi:hypothetical protein